MELKYRKIRLYPKGLTKGVPTSLRLHYDKYLQQYVLCQTSTGILGLGYTHWSVEELQDALKILKKENRSMKNG